MNKIKSKIHPDPIGAKSKQCMPSGRYIRLFLVGILVLGFGISSPTFAAAPTISYIELTSLTDTSAVITWRTDTASNTRIQYGHGLTGLTSSFTKSETDTKYHYLELTGLTPNTTYYYIISSANSDGTTEASPNIFTTLQTPDGTYLFSFATISDLQYADGKADTSSLRGRKYSSSEVILTALVANINSQSPAFTIIKGDIAEAGAPYGDQVAAKIKPKLDTLTGDAISGFANKYFAIPGNHDKGNTYTGGNWVSKNLGLLVPEKIAVAPGTDSDFNYSFNYKGYHFVMLDSVKAASPYGGHVDTAWLTSNLDANSTKKTFIFMHNPAGDVTKTIPTEEVLGVTISEWQIDNISDFQAIIKSRKTQIAGVFMGHVHDNNYFVSEEATGGVPFVRTSSAMQFPAGYNIYKVYSGGYMQTFYKLASSPQIGELGRDQVTSGQGQSADHWMQFWLGASSARNFIQTYSIPTSFPPTVLEIVPALGSASIARNSNIIIKFSQAMDTASVQSAFSLSPALSGTYSWNSANTILTFTPSTNYGSGTLYTATIATTAKDASGNALEAAYLSSFTAGTSSDTTAPAVAFDRMANDITTNISPTITGTAEDASSPVISLECRVDGGSWESATPLDGTFNSTRESFAFYITSPLARGLHTVEARAANTSGITTSGTYDSYSFTLTGAAPFFSMLINNTPVMNNDSISSTPLIRVSVLTASPLNTGTIKFLIDSAPVGFTTTKESETIYTLLHQVTSPLGEGLHSISIEATDADGDISTWEVTNLSVKTTSAAEIKGNPLNYPNPFDPTTGTSISYYLTKDSGVQINIYDISSNLIVSKSYAAGTSGGNAGYNEASWNGKSDSGLVIGNGMYLYLIISDGKVVAKGKMMALK